MSERIRTIRLYGKLGARFGRVHRLAVDSAAEAARALCVLLPGFRHELSSSEERGVRYAVFVGKDNLTEKRLHEPPGGNDIRIAPILQGSKRAGVFQIIAGAILVVVGAVLSYFSFGAGAPLMKLGAAMIVGGVVQMLSPQPRGLSAKDSPNNGASYNFNGPVNTSAQGNPVPILYGRMIVGSAVISGGIYAEDQA
ncbi:tail assembly protein [Cupriavidus plantarum]|uniref:tail assembly protein n=1 Tax=Cupriavidus plantarum TaxID=942865 RepID=UPI000EADFD4C|nr:tail assembly protein [Cupriavidus plantarum]RLK45939.1 putative phage tail protein [Cupriavidus plantarum]